MVLNLTEMRVIRYSKALYSLFLRDSSIYLSIIKIPVSNFRCKDLKLNLKKSREFFKNLRLSLKLKNKSRAKSLYEKLLKFRHFDIY